MTFPKNHRPGSSWRTLVHRREGERGYGKPIEDDNDRHAAPTEFDELVIDDFLHVEQQDPRNYWMRVGPLRINVTVGERGQARVVSVTEEDDGYLLKDIGPGESVWTKT